MCHLWYDYVCQGAGQTEQLQRVLQAQRGVVDHVVLDAVVDVGNLADVVAAALHAEVPLQLGPALQHQLQGLTVVQLQVWGRTQVAEICRVGVYAVLEGYFDVGFYCALIIKTIYIRLMILI